MSAKEGGSDNKVSLHIIVKTYLREEKEKNIKGSIQILIYIMYFD